MDNYFLRQKITLKDGRRGMIVVTKPLGIEGEYGFVEINENTNWGMLQLVKEDKVLCAGWIKVGK